MNDNSVKISIIVPVYKVEQYIDQCLESICVQTYKNLEIIVVCDESPDNSQSRCEYWAEKDKRIHLIINKQRKGLGAARNIGLRMARGKYIVYVDSDDWIERQYVEILYKAIERTEADYVSSVGYYEVNADGGVNICKALPAGEYSSDSERMLILLKEIRAVWKKIYNREWLIKNQLFQPELFHYEDWGFDIGLVSQAKKIVLISEKGVFYRNERGGSLSNDNLKVLYQDFRRSIEFGLQQMEQVGLIDQYRVIIQKYLLHDYYLRMSQVNEVYDQEALQILKKIKSDILIKRLGYQGAHEGEKCICFGSFSLRWIAQNTTIFVNDLEYYGFSSIISAMTRGEKLNVKNESEFRVCQVLQDITGRFGRVLELIQEKTVLFVDLLEERNSILELGCEQYITRSEVYQSSFIEKNCAGGYIQSGEEKFIILWKRKCQDFIEKLSQKKKLLTIILVKNRLSLQYGDLNYKKNFKDIEKLKQTNNMITELENYFLECCDQRRINIGVLDLPEQYCFTEEDFRYGCEPQYMNEALYTYLGFQIFNEVCGGIRIE